jgi:RNA polymerase sigma-70 factor (ECF subfamily)
MKTDSFADLLNRLYSDEDAAARDVFQRYSRRLIAVTRRHIGPGLAHRVDPEDVVQSAFKSFFLRHREGKLRVGDWDNMWGLLALITRRKCADRVEYLRAGRRDVDRELSISASADQPWLVAADREPLPEEVASLTEMVERLRQAAGDDERAVLELSLQGYTAAEIALRLGKALRTVQRLRERIHQRLLRLQDNG